MSVEASTRNPYPTGAVRYLAESGFRGKVMTPFDVGACVSWTSFPAVRVGLDSRYEVAFDPAFVEEGMAVYAGSANPPRAWRDFLGPTGMHQVPARTTGDFHEQLLTEAGRGRDAVWSLVYRDDAHALFARRDVASRLPYVDRRNQPLPSTFA